MSVLEFHTRDNTQPHGKSGVYFTAHPADADAYLQQLEKDLFLMQDCVVWFDTEPGREVDESFLSELSYLNMQLMVIPVTKKLLTEPNRVTSWELSFALTRHIPVLPIMMERGLDPFYNPIFGDIQYLDRVSKDITALPYEEKLGTFLDSVLVGDEAAERIRAAFDALIFLSYRKKDRALAHELMELIHRIPELLAVGIWYDEFLVPGEGFNGGIQSAISRSDLCILTVTPNLVNEDNFIKETEYNWVKVDYGKEVVPAQMSETDPQLLGCFHGLPAPVDAHDEEALRRALLGHLNTKLARKDQDALRLYLLGLAYLHGIEMETDKERGLELITQAAEAGLLEAKEKLVQMYFHGHGVARDYNESIRWQKEVVEAYAQQYRREPNEDTWFRYTWELSYLGDDLVQMRRLEEAIPVFEETAKLLREQLAKEEKLKYRERLSYVLRELALTYETRNDRKAVIRTLESAVRSVEEAPEASFLLRRYHAQALCDLGLFHQQEGRHDTALSLCEESMKLAEQLLDEDDSNDTLHILARIAYRLAEFQLGYGNWEQAEFNYKMALYLMKKVFDGVPTTAESQFLGECLRSAGEFYEMREDPDNAMGLYKKSIEIYEAVQEVCNTEHLQQMYQLALRSLETLQIRLNGQLGNKRPRFVKIADDRKTADSSLQNRSELADANRAWAKACSFGGNHEKAKARFGVAIDLYRAILEETEQPEDACTLAAIHVDLVEAMRKADQWEPMPQLLTTAKELCLEGLNKKDLPELRRELARAHTYLGRFYMHLEGQFYEAALERYLEALPLWKQLVEETNHLHMRLFYSECKTDIAECYLHMKGEEAKDAADRYSEEALAELLALYQRSPSPDAAMCLKKSYQNRGFALLGCGQRQEALLCFTEIYHMLPKLADQYSEQDYRYQRAQMLYLMGDLTPGKPGIRHLKDARAIMEELCKQQPFNASYKQALALVLLSLKHH